MVKALPNTSFLPVSKSAPAGHATAAAHLLWQVFPRYPCLEYKDNSVKAARSGIRGRLLWAWAYVLAKAVNLTPQFVAYQFPGHLLHPHWYFTAYSSICQVLLGALSATCASGGLRWVCNWKGAWKMAVKRCTQEIYDVVGDVLMLAPLATCTRLLCMPIHLRPAS